ncbi:protein required for normal CLN1 and CLN2 G1 cyclin expression [Microsporum canis]
MPRARHRKTSSLAEKIAGPELMKSSRHIYEREPPNYGILAQLIRSFLIVAWFSCCCVCIVVAQVVGLPLYLVKREYFNAYVATTKESFGLAITALTEWSAPTPVRISGDRSVLGQVTLTSNGGIQTRFPDRLVLIANHQVYTDWLYLWWVTYTNQMHGHIYIILKESLKYIPLVGQGMTLYGFIFMARKWMADKPRLQHRLKSLCVRRGDSTPGSPVFDPMWLLIFPEGTNLSIRTKEVSDNYGRKNAIPPFKHELLPRSTGLYFCLQQLKGTVDYVYDCTMGYEGPPKGSYPDSYFTIRSTYLKCRPPRVVNFYWRRFALADIPLDKQEDFEAWLFERWAEKDALLDAFIETGKFPPFEDADLVEMDPNSPDIQTTSGKNHGYVEGEVRLDDEIFLPLPDLLTNFPPVPGVRQTPFARALVMAPFQNGLANGSTGGQDTVPKGAATARFSDIPSAIDIPASTFDSEVEISLQELPDDPTELCTLLDNEKAAKNFWVIIALAYAKQKQIDHAIEILTRGLASLAHGATKEKLSLLGWICWLYLIKSRQAPRVAPEGQLYSEAKTKEFYLQAATATLNEASRLNPAFPPLFLARGVLSILRASLQPPSKPVRPGTVDTSERVESLQQAIKCFDESSKAFGGRNIMAILGRARANYMLGRYGEALEGYQEALVKMPNMRDPDPRIGIGCCLWQLDFKDQAKVAWNRALTLNPDSKAANILLAAYYLHDSSRHSTSDPEFSSLYKTAMTQYTQKAFKLDKEYPMTCATFGSYFLLRKHFPTVEALARKAIELTDVNAIASDGWYLLARKEHTEGDPERALEYYNRSDQARGGADKGYPPAKFGAVQMLVKRKDFDGAKFRLEKIIQQTKNPEAMALLGSLYADEVFAASNSKEDKSAEAKKAISLLESVRTSWKADKKKLTPDESVLLYLSRLYEVSAPEKSMQCLNQVEEMQLAQIPEDERPDDVEGEKAMTEVLRERLAPQLLNNIGCFLYQADKIEQARNMLQTALNACVKAQEREDASDTDAYVTTISYNLARTYEAAGMPNEAKKVYEGLLERHSDYVEANARLTYIALRQSPTDEGPKKMAKLYEAEATNMEVRALFGWYLSKSKRRVANLAEDLEQRHYKHTLQGYDKHDRYALTGMGNLYLLTGRDMRRDGEQDKEKRRKIYEKAVEFFDKALQLDPKNAYAAQGIAIALVDDRKDYSTAVQIFSKVRDTLRDSSVYLNLGHVFAELRQFTKSIENYEISLSKDRARDAQILACLGRVWFLKGKQEQNLSAMKTALEYAERARSVAPDQIHLEFNIAFVQNEIGLLAISLPEAQKTSEEVEEAMNGVTAAIEAFDKIANSKNPPYPRSSLESRATMCRNTIRNQLQRTLQSQKEYEEKNAAKLQQARELRDAEIKRREEEKRKAEEAEKERKRQIAEERQLMIEEAERLTAIRIDEERAREAAEYTTDSETGERYKRQQKKSKGGKRKKKADAEKNRQESEPRNSGSSTEGEEEERSAAPRKRRRLERRGNAKSNKFKSTEIVVESESESENIEVNGDKAGSPPANGNDDEDEDALVQRRRKKTNLRIEDDDDEEEEPKEATPAGDNDDDDLFDEKSPAADEDANKDVEMKGTDEEE